MNRINHIHLMANYNEWMNIKIDKSARNLSHDELVLDRKAFFGSILGTLNHLLLGDKIWLSRFAKHPANYSALAQLRDFKMPAGLDSQLYSDFETLAKERKRIDEIMINWSKSIQENELDFILPYQNSEGVYLNKIYFSLIMHFFNHQTHHRGQISTLLFQAGIDIGVTDLGFFIPNQINNSKTI